jgi:hypothetical protein
MGSLTRYMGIDPGKSGGWAVLRADGSVWAVGRTSDTTTLLTALMVEKVGASPQMGRTSAFSFGESYGVIQGMLLAQDYELLLVTPQKWQKEFGLIQKTPKGEKREVGRNSTAKKKANKAMAAKLFPGQKITHAWADALLIAEYCRRVFG